ncbi:MAG: amino acid adenylation domain-containing protein [Bacteroidales bacterium]
MHINIIDFFEDTLKEHSEKIAIIEKNSQITFAELAHTSKSLAMRLVKTYNIVNKPIAVFLPKSIQAVCADIAISYSGNMYMNLDINNPIERIKAIIQTVKPLVVITDTKGSETLSSLHVDIINIDSVTWHNYDNDVLLQRLSQLIDTDPLCIINTSGSTGTPKSVVLNHRSYIDYTQWAIGEFQFTDKEILGVLSPIIFDHYNFEISLMMTKGVTLVLLNNNFAAFPAKILEELVKHKVTFIFWVPAIMVNIANMNILDKFDLSSLKMVWFAGEVFPTKQFNKWRKVLPNTCFVNLYGPVETTVDCTYYVVNRELSDEESIPIGNACRNTNVLILDDNNHLITQKGIEGELCVRGASLAMGYYNNPEKTSITFVQNPLNTSYPETIYRTGDIVYINQYKEIVFKGRKDSLIKHMGYRIELGEIEHNIVNSIPEVKQVCVVYNFQSKEIVLFYESDKEIPVSDFRKNLLKVLPKYMLPIHFYREQQLKRNANEKIDRLFYLKKISE